MVIEGAALLSLHLVSCQIPFAVFFDLSKAFDMIDHNIFLHKLYHYGIRGVAKQLFKSYITNTQQFVQVNDIRYNVITTKLAFHSIGSSSISYIYIYT